MNHPLTITRFKNIWSAESTKIQQTVLFLLGVLLIIFASQLSIPLKPVPLTFQSVTVILIGMTYGKKQGSLIIATYLIAGACGFPVFADFSAGIQKFLGPTSGYLIGFLPAAFVSGYLAEKGFAKNILTSFITAFIGASIIFIFGISFLATFIGIKQALQLGFMPFIASEIIKLALLACVMPSIWKKR